MCSYCKEAQQELLATDLQLSDLKLKINDLMGLPLTTALDLDSAVAEYPQTCQPEECVADAMALIPRSSKLVTRWRRRRPAVRLANTDIWVPDVEAFRRYSYANDVPFLAKKFGTFGVHFGYDLFDAGKKRAVLREREAQVSVERKRASRD